MATAPNLMRMPLEVMLGGILLPLTPQAIKPIYEAHFIDHSIIADGKITAPRGREPRTASWQGMLPGPRRQFQPFVRNYQAPNGIIANLTYWCEGGLPVRLTIPSTEIDWSVFIRRFEPDISGASGDRHYTITVVEERRLQLGAADRPTEAPSRNVAQPTGKPYRAVQDDTYWTVAQKELKDGDRWPEVQAMNPNVTLDADNHIPAGTILKVPQR